MKNTKNNNKAQQVLINNLRKQLATKRDSYMEMIYRAAIMQIVNDKIPYTKSVLDKNFPLSTIKSF
jgi:hypothetical protein